MTFNAVFLPSGRLLLSASRRYSIGCSDVRLRFLHAKPLLWTSDSQNCTCSLHRELILLQMLHFSMCQLVYASYLYLLHGLLTTCRADQSTVQHQVKQRAHVLLIGQPIFFSSDLFSLFGWPISRLLSLLPLMHLFPKNSRAQGCAARCIDKLKHR